MSVFHNNALIGAAGQGAAAGAGYEIERSLRFNSADSAYLSRTPASAGNRKTWTWAGWVKRSSLTTAGYYLFSSQEAANTNNVDILGFSSNTLYYYQAYTGATTSVSFVRDPSAWYHIVFALDTTQATEANRLKIYANGILQPLNTGFIPAQDRLTSINAVNSVHQIGRYVTTAKSDFYLADVHFIDGQALDPTSFGEFDDNGVWQPIDASGLTYGTNGFHLPFSDNSSASALGTDDSGNGNDWTVNNISVSSLSYTTSGGTVTSAAQAFDGDVTTFSQTSTGQNSTYTLSPSVAVPNGRIDLHARYGTAFTYKAVTNIGTITFSHQGTWPGGGSSYPGHYYINNASVTSFSAIILETSSSSSNWTFTGVQVAGDPNSVGNQFLVTAPASGIDSLLDSPTNGDTANDTGAGGEVPGNYAVWNRLFVSSNSARTTISNGNLDVTSVTTPGNYAAVFATLGISSGKFYWEVTQNNSAAIMLGIAPSSNPRNNYYLGESSNEWGYYSGNGTVYSGGSSVASYTQYAAGDVVGIAFDADNGKLFFSLNGTWQGSSDPAAGTNPAASGITTLPQFPAVSEGSGSQTLDVSANFGQRAFAYTAPSGFKALCTANLDTPTIEDGSDYFDTLLYNANGSTQSITGLNFSPDLVWSKSRNRAYPHGLHDSVRGAYKYLRSSGTNAETDTSGDPATYTLTSFDANGFSVGQDGGAGVINNNAAGATTYAAWCWDAGSSTVANTDGSISSSVRANASAGFSIVSYTGTGSAATVGHGLGIKPDMVIIKNRSSSGYDWKVMHEGLTGAMGTYQIQLNGIAEETPASASWFNSTSPTSTVFSVGTLSAVNGSGSNYVAYCFAPVEGYSAFGSYTGNGSSDGPFVYTGFRPRWLLTKRTDATAGWYLFDTARLGYNPDNELLYPNYSNAEANVQTYDLLSNGFKVRTVGTVNNASGGTYVWASFAENPFSIARAR